MFVVVTMIFYKQILAVNLFETLLVESYWIKKMDVKHINKMTHIMLNALR